MEPRKLREIKTEMNVPGSNTVGQLPDQIPARPNIHSIPIKTGGWRPQSKAFMMFGSQDKVAKKQIVKF